MGFRLNADIRKQGLGCVAVVATLVLAIPEYLHGIHHRNEAAAIAHIRAIQ